MNDQSINYSYLSGFLQSTLRNIPDVLVREGLINWECTLDNSSVFERIQKIIDKELKRAVEAERRFSSR